MRARRRWTAEVAAAAVLGVLVTGCTGESAPPPSGAEASATDRTVRATPSPEPSTTTPATPSPPAATSSGTVEGAEAVARYAIDVLNYASATADLSEWNRITAPSCTTCVSFAEDIRRSGPDPAGATSVDSSKATEINPGVFYTAALVVTQSPYTRPDGTPDDGGNYALLFALRFTDGWIIEAIDVGAPDAPWAS